MPAPWAAVARLTIRGQVQNQDCINVLHFATNTVINDPATLNQLLQDLCTHMIECIVDTLLPGVTSDYRLNSVQASTVAPTLSDPIEVAAPANSVGAQSDTSVSFAASLLNVRTGLGGRKGRGKIFLPPPGENSIANSTLGQASVDAFVLFIACVAGKFIGAGATTPWRFGVLSRVDFANTPANANTAFREALTIIVNPNVAKMGSRKRGSGN
jgi:hypothetical protein